MLTSPCKEGRTQLGQEQVKGDPEATGQEVGSAAQADPRWTEAGLAGVPRSRKWTGRGLQGAARGQPGVGSAQRRGEPALCTGRGRARVRGGWAALCSDGDQYVASAGPHGVRKDHRGQRGDVCRRLQVGKAVNGAFPGSPGGATLQPWPGDCGSHACLAEPCGGEAVAMVVRRPRQEPSRTSLKCWATWPAALRTVQPPGPSQGGSLPVPSRHSLACRDRGGARRASLPLRCSPWKLGPPGPQPLACRRAGDPAGCR